MTPLRIGVIGIGNMGKIHARVLGNLRMLAAVADIDYEKAREVTKAYGAHSFDDFETMLHETQMDGVIIATPTATHAEITRRIAENFEIKGILIEKPIASTLRDAEAVASILRRKRVVTLVSHSEIYNPVVDRALTLIHSNTIGQPRTVIHDRRGFVQPSRLHALGDVFEDIGVHDFDIMSRISSGPAKLYAQGNEEQGVCNSATVLVRFDHGTIHVFNLSRQYAGRTRLMDVSGTKGVITLDLFAQIIKVQDLDQEPLADGRAIKLPERGATIKVYGEPVQEVINDFIKCIELGTAPKVGLDDGITALKIVEAARESSRTGHLCNIEIQRRV